MHPLERRLREALRAGRKALVPYVTAGLPGVDAALLRGLEGAGADALEVGIPFSDPVMDGPVIQEASQRALARGTRPADAFALVSEAALDIPVLVMTYLNPVLAAGEEAFLANAAVAGVAGVIVPDLPVDEGQAWGSACEAAGVASVFLAAPGASDDRLRAIAEASTGFVYCVSTYGVTGARDALSTSSRELVERLRPLTDRPLLMGVGISTPEQAAEACTFADGVVVGTSVVHELLQGGVGAAALVETFREAL